MQADFWHNIWESNEIGFHLNDVNPMLVKHIGALGMGEGQRIFLPLCGKTRDIAWLLSRGYEVVGCELSDIAVEQLFEHLTFTPDITPLGGVKIASAPNLDIVVGDFFNLTDVVLGHVDAIYDRAALVALPLDMRSTYTAHLRTITHRAPQLLVTFDYDQSKMAGPPFSLSEAEVNFHYSLDYRLTLLDNLPVEGGLKGICPAMEQVWHMA